MIATGKRFGRLVVQKKGVVVGNGETVWLCRCDCGASVAVLRGNLKSGNTRSCGCLWRNKVVTHRLSRSPVYWVWANLIQRCTNPKNPGYRNYGGRGISVCAEWKRNPDNFLAWAKTAGYRRGLDLDRIDNNGPYCPANCRWTTRSINLRNRRTWRQLHDQGAGLQDGVGSD
jgi:hypothetical protein